MADNLTPGPNDEIVETETMIIAKEEGLSYDAFTDEEKEFYEAADITAGDMGPYDISRAWKVLVVYRDIALERADFERAVLYSHVIDDLARLLEAINFPLPAVLDEKGEPRG